MRNKEHYKSMLSAVHTISEAVREKPFNQDMIQSLEAAAAPIVDFFSVSLEEAIVLCYCIDANLKDQVINKESITTHFGKEITALADVYEHIENLAKKKLIFLTNRDRKYALQFKFIHLNPKVPAAMSEGDVNILGLRQCSNFADFLMEVNDLIVLRINQHVSTHELLLEITQLIENCKSIREVKWIKKQKKIKGNDLLIFLNVCVEQSDGDEEVDLDKMINEVLDSAPERMKYKQALKCDRCILLKENYIVYAGNIFGIMNLVQLSEETLGHLMQYMSNEHKREFIPRMGTLINCEKIAEEKLFYNQRERKQISTLKNALSVENYKLLIKRMKDNNMSSGFTALLYGAPGVGKTATVKALARATGRHIFMVDIPKINSKWVGESEKNLSRLFDEYRRARKAFSEHPILLFNEADAILGKRIASNTSVDKMHNTMQNILLQELEDFEGIFIATTNLADHLDNAFFRRFHYKVEFNKPDEAVRFNILQNSFSDLDIPIIEKINQNFDLTGGQIANVQRKLMVKKVLDEFSCLEDEIFALCEEENALREHARPIIGFNNHR